MFPLDPPRHDRGGGVDDGIGEDEEDELGDGSPPVKMEVLGRPPVVMWELGETVATAAMACYEAAEIESRPTK